jgi:hypothetical protein
MKRLTIFIAVSFALCMPCTGYGQDTGSSPQQASNFQNLLQSGQWVTLVQERDGYRVHIMEAKSEFTEVSVSDVNERYARAAHGVKTAEYDNAVEKNVKNPGSYGEAQLRQLKLDVTRAALQIEQATEDAARERAKISQRKSIQQIYHIGDDYVGMRYDNIETFIPIRLIRAITRNVPRAPSADK